MGHGQETVPGVRRVAPARHQTAFRVGTSAGLKEFPMKRYHLIVAAMICHFLAGCSSQPQDLIIGKWQVADGGGDTVEFSSDGTVTVVMGGQTARGKYKFEKESVLNVSWDSPLSREGFQEGAAIQYVK